MTDTLLVHYILDHNLLRSHRQSPDPTSKTVALSNCTFIFQEVVSQPFIRERRGRATGSRPRACQHCVKAVCFIERQEEARAAGQSELALGVYVSQAVN